MDWSEFLEITKEDSGRGWWYNLQRYVFKAWMGGLMFGLGHFLAYKLLNIQFFSSLIPYAKKKQ